uniref:NAD(+) kinase n=1 Tax=Panagrolaimus sp. JU765 TaxID=591449 RepID=A0AC34QHJ9_9BILA
MKFSRFSTLLFGKFFSSSASSCGLAFARSRALLLMNVVPTNSIRFAFQQNLTRLISNSIDIPVVLIPELLLSYSKSIVSAFNFKIGNLLSRSSHPQSSLHPQTFPSMGLVLDENPAVISLPIAQEDYDSTLGLIRKHGEFAPKKVLIVSKTTRLQYELHRAKLDISHVHDPSFISRLRRRGTDFLELKRKHEMQTSYIDAIVRELKKDNIDVKVATRTDYTKDLALWGDLIISAGGDGTFLTAASKVRNATPVIGINTDPIGSEGHLCLTGKLRRPADEVIRQFLSGDFYWTQRQRIRVTITKVGDTESPPPVAAGKRSRESKACNFFSDDESEELEPPVEPMLALNEVFIGESHAARVSYYEVQVDDGPLLKQKSSGMTVCTGTGSTSWHYNINRLNEQTVGEIIRIMGDMGFKSNDEINDKVVEEICSRFNRNLIFEPSAHKMAFSVRDPVFNATFPKASPRGFARKIKVKSRCTHAHLVLDGSTSIPFNHGTEVVLELIPQDALQTVILKHV